MSDMPTQPPEREERLGEILLAYLEAAQAGNAPDRGRLLADHPDLAADLEEFFAGRDQLDLLGARVREAAGLSGATALLQRPAGAPALGVIGDFRILREVGRGGMGVVYEAEQISLGRRVALKMLPFAAALDPKQLQRFRNEAQAAAQLHHPNIVPVYAVGTERGVHYYAMQFIEGQSLAALVDELRGQPDQATPAPAAPTAVAAATKRSATGTAHWRRVALLGKKAAEALEHAHQFGVVHRDVKPANLLLDAHGNLWVTDFGLALMHSDTGLTATGEMLGTIRYMSPEQALARRGLVDHRTDVYALGVTLYELLTLQPAFDGADRNELLCRIAVDDPTAPRSINRAIPVELETVVLKAMAKNPADRYGTAQEMAEDLQRFLDDRPIQARRPTLWDRVRKWSRRHRAVVISGALLLLLTLVGSLITTLLIADAERTRAREAQRSFAQAKRLVDFFTQVSEEELANFPPAEGLRRRLLEAALEYYQGFIEQRGDDPAQREELQASHARVAKILAELAALQGSGRFLLLTDAAVQKDLGLDEEQQRQTKELAKTMFERWGEEFRGGLRRSAEERRARALATALETEKAVAAILTPAQDRRLKQINLQVRQQGPQGFTAPEIASALKLTARQKQEIKAIQDETHHRVMECFGPPSEKGPRKLPEGVWEEARAKTLALLTDAQRAKWRELTGPALQGRVRMPPPGFGPPPFGGPMFGPPPGRPFGPGFLSKEKP